MATYLDSAYGSNDGYADSQGYVGNTSGTPIVSSLSFLWHFPNLRIPAYSTLNSATFMTAFSTKSTSVINPTLRMYLEMGSHPAPLQEGENVDNRAWWKDLYSADWTIPIRPGDAAPHAILSTTNSAFREMFSWQIGKDDWTRQSGITLRADPVGTQSGMGQIYFSESLATPFLSLLQLDYTPPPNPPTMKVRTGSQWVDRPVRVRVTSSGLGSSWRMPRAIRRRSGSSWVEV